jgi:hypothetical protein
LTFYRKLAIIKDANLKRSFLKKASNYLALLSTEVAKKFALSLKKDLTSIWQCGMIIDWEVWMQMGLTL